MIPSSTFNPFRLPLIGLALGAALSVYGLTAARQDDKPAASQFPVAHFHHLHLNTTDPAAAIDFYTSHFDCQKDRFAGIVDAVRAQKSWLLFSKVSAPPAWSLNTAIWHMGWGAEDMKAEYERQLKLGSKFFEPLTDISDIGGNPNAKPGSFYYAYVQSPDHALIELNTARHHQFGHLHLFSADPVAAGRWYQKYFGARLLGSRSEVRLYRGYQIGPSASLMLDNVNLIIFPVEYSKKAYAAHWQGKTEIESTKGRVFDHVGFSFDNLAEAVEKLRQDGVKVTDEIRPGIGGKVKSAFIEGPDKIRIELVEGQAKKEP